MPPPCGVEFHDGCYRKAATMAVYLPSILLFSARSAHTDGKRAICSTERETPPRKGVASSNFLISLSVAPNAKLHPARGWHLQIKRALGSSSERETPPRKGWHLQRNLSSLLVRLVSQLQTSSSAWVIGEPAGETPCLVIS
jgi:hypothetical protein